jgi:hypothetical protein
MKTINKPIVFRLLKRAEKPSTEGRHYPLSFRLPSSDQVYDEGAGRARVIRYAIGEQSVFQDEQKNERPIIGDVIFSNGTIIVDRRETLLLEYLTKSNYYQSNPNRMPNTTPLYDIIDNSVNAESTVNNIELEHTAVDIALKMTPQQLVAYCDAAGLDSNRSMYELKHDVLALAKRDPQKFLESASNPLTDMNQIIKDAIKFKIIYMNKTKREFGFLNGKDKEMITAVPQGQDMMEYFVEYCMTDEGAEAYEVISSKIESMM